MRKVLLAALCTACVALLAPALAGAAVIVPADMTVGNDLGHRSAVVHFTLPTESNEGTLLAPAVCVPAPDSEFLVGTTPVACDGTYMGQTCIDFGFPIGVVCFPTPAAAAQGIFDVTVKIVRCTILGTAGPETLPGTALGDWICGRGDRDLIKGLAGRDILVGGAGPDTLIGGLGKDKLFGGKGSDVLKARDGVADRLDCGGGANDIAIADSHDVVRANCERVRRG
jgi:hypothetical protein